MVAVVMRAFLVAALIMGAAAAAPPSRADEGVTLEPLPPQDLPAGRCGLFLWSKEQQPNLIFVGYTNPGEGRIRAGGRNRYLPLTRFGREQVLGVFERQTYADGRLSVEIEVAFDPDRPLRNGAVLKEGVIRVKDGDKWESITPIGGMVACQS
jgi:hypothetical protein